MTAYVTRCECPPCSESAAGYGFDIITEINYRHERSFGFDEVVLKEKRFRNMQEALGMAEVLAKLESAAMCGNQHARWKQYLRRS